MKTYGVNSENSLFYEKVAGFSYGISQPPTALPLSFIDISGGDAQLKTGNLGPGIHNVDFIFLDDGYDPTTRIRRGRILEANPNKPTNWISSPHPLLTVPKQKIGINGTINHQVYEFKPLNHSGLLSLISNQPSLVCIGNENFKTTWRLIDLEAGLFGDSIVYLKARGSFGSLPRLMSTEISDTSYRLQVSGKYEQLQAELFSATPDSVIDRCRELASAAINAYLFQKSYRIETGKALDLGHLVGPLREGPKLNIAANSVDTLAKLHSRSKHTEQVNRGVRPNTEMDAQLSIILVSTILVELNLAAWE